MRVEIAVIDKKGIFRGIIEVPADRILRPFTLRDGGGRELEIEARTTDNVDFQCIVGDRKKVSFQFSQLRIEEEQWRFTGQKNPGWKFVSSPWRVGVTRLFETGPKRRWNEAKD